ncbi:MAG: AGE family epimerase/isomerase [Oscillospiraceae bacterium]|nr:AGE family epimerase/isomerase [Oscillospiraceae bacterium]
MVSTEFRSELTQHIIPFWNKLRDDENGGFTGFMDSALNIDKKGEKGVILHSRILWFYSNAYLLLKDETLLDNAKHAFKFLTEKCVDKEYGGVYWSMNYDGSVKDDIKHTYCQAFFVYALSSYYRASGDKQALELAYSVVDLIEKNATDDVAYLEKLSRDWKTVLANDELSENGLMADKTMNTTLHLMEAYTELYLADKNEKVLERLKFQLQLTYDKIFDQNGNKLLVFFDKNMDVIGDIHSYGHDIEATWLVDRACDVIGDKDISEKFGAMNKRIVRNIADIAYHKETGSLLNERENDKINTWRIWWVQAETVVGFLNAYQRGYGNDEYLDIASNVWDFIKDNIIDKREGGEWHSQLDDSMKYAEFKPEVDPWKCPYHNGRMCIEAIERLENNA